MPTGTHVKKGDLLAEFDRQAQTRDALDRQAEYDDFAQQINKLKATQAADKASDDTDIKAAEDSLATAVLEVKRSEIKSRIDAEKAKENLDEATAKLAQLRQTYALRRQSATAAVRLLEIQRESKKLAVDHANKNADLLAIHAPNDGLVVVNSTFKNTGFSEWQNGDQVRAGAAFMQVVNPGAMRVRGQVNQQDIPQMQVGQKVEVRLDAYPEMVFHGHVDLISSVGVPDDFSSKLHTFMMLFVIDGQDAKLLPDLSAAVDVELERLTNALIVPRDALVSEEGKMFVRVASGSSSEKREVKVLRIDDVEAAVDAKLQPGETVIRSVAPEIIPVVTASVAAPKK
jgi:HlyD family secretion protein